MALVQSWWKKDLTHTSEVHHKQNWNKIMSNVSLNKIWCPPLQDEVSSQRECHISRQSNRLLHATSGCHLWTWPVSGTRGRHGHLPQPGCGCKWVSPHCGDSWLDSSSALNSYCNSVPKPKWVRAMPVQAVRPCGGSLWSAIIHFSGGSRSFLTCDSLWQLVCELWVYPGFVIVSNFYISFYFILLLVDFILVSFSSFSLLEKFSFSFYIFIYNKIRMNEWTWCLKC